MKKKIAGALTALVTAVLLVGCGSQVNVPLNQMKVEKYVTLGDYANLQVKADAASVDPEELEALLNDVYLSGVTAETGGSPTAPWLWGILWSWTMRERGTVLPLREERRRAQDSP